MNSIRTAVWDVIDRRPEAVYEVLADYRIAHPRILPPRYFAGLEVVRGGHGAGTIVRVTMRVLGTERTLQMTVTEPDPGRVLAEADNTAGITTTFTVAPVVGGARSLVEIATEWEYATPRAALEARLSALFARLIYKQELRRLAEYVREQEAASDSNVIYLHERVNGW